MGICERCASHLTAIDHYGERLTGCVECNFWQGSKRAFIVVELSVEDFEALRGWETNGRKARSIQRRNLGGSHRPGAKERE